MLQLVSSLECRSEHDVPTIKSGETRNFTQKANVLGRVVQATCYVAFSTNADSRLKFDMVSENVRGECLSV